MKKNLIIMIVLYSLNVIPTFADDNNFQLGIKGGLNRSNVYDTKGDQFVADATYGLILGAFVTIPIIDIIGVQAEMQFSQKGFEGNGGSGSLTYSFKRTTNFIDIPIMGQLKLDKRFSLLAGVQYSYLASQNTDFLSGITSVTLKDKFENENYRKNIMGIIIGADLNLIGKVISARASWDVMDNTGDGSSTLPRYKNVLIQLTFGFVLL